MPDLKIKNVSPEILTRLDEIVGQKKYSDRSDLIRDVLQKYALFGDDFYTKQLPETIRFLVGDLLKEYPEKFSELFRYTLEILNENTRLLRKIESYFEPETEDL